LPTGQAVASRHLVTLKAMCLNADILGRNEQREALGWALARLNELSGTKVAEALSGRLSEAMGARVEELEAQVQDLDALIDFVCQYAKIDRKRIENTMKARQSLTK
jgi:hypothetical protein